MTIVYNEEELLRQISAGNEQAFRQVYDQYKNRIYAFALGIVRTVPLAEEIVQECFTRLWLRREELVSINKFESWFFTIARNLCYTALRKMALEEKALQKQTIPADDLSPEELVITKEDQALLQQAINQLSAKQKLVYTMSREQGMTYDEIAGALHISRNTVKEHLARANAGIKAFLQTHLPATIVTLIYFFEK